MSKLMYEAPNAFEGLAYLASDPEPLPRPLARGTTVFAVGDVHGHLRHLEAMLAVIQPAIGDAVARGQEVHLVLIGDFIDRGPASLGVLELLDGLDRWLGVPVHCLRGNHDDYIIDFLLSPQPSPPRFELWMNNGGAATLAELGIGYAELGRGDLAGVRERLRSRLPNAVLTALSLLQPAWRCGEWLFVHAGIDPVTPLADQDPATWMTIRDPFLSPRRWRHDLAVVHGHTIRGPEIMPHRLGLDSGVYKTGVLTSVEMGGGSARFRCIADRADLSRFEALPWRLQKRRFGAPEALRDRRALRRADAA